MIEISEDSMINFAKLLIEAAGAYEVQEDRTVQTAVEKTQCGVDIAGGKKAPVKLFKEGDIRAECAYLQPFKESCTNTGARSWFYHVATLNVSILLKRLIQKAVELAAKKSSTDPDQMEVLNKIMNDADDTMITEVAKVRPDDFVNIIYTKKNKHAELIATYWYPETQEKYNFRKKTWKVIDLLISIFLNTEQLFKSENPDTKIHEYTATLLNIPETESKLHVIIDSIMRMAPYAELFLERDLHADELCEHLKLLTGYNKLHLYLNADNTYPAPAAPQQQIINPIGPPGLFQTPQLGSTPAPVATTPTEYKPYKAPINIPKPTADVERLVPTPAESPVPTIPQVGYSQPGYSYSQPAYGVTPYPQSAYGPMPQQSAYGYGATPYPQSAYGQPAYQPLGSAPPWNQPIQRIV